MADQLVTLRITADGKGAIQEIVKVSTATRGMGEAGSQGGQRAASGLDAISKAAAKTEKDASAARSQLIKLIAAAGGLTVLAKGAISYADSYSRINSQLRLVTDSEASLNRVRSATFDLAQRTRSEFETTAVLYARLTRATEQLGTTEAQRLRIVETINKSFAISNASAQEMSAAIIQLSQGLAAGALRGDEFNSVNEQAPKLMDLLAASLGKTKGELRAYAEEGKLTASVITRAFLEGSNEIDREFGTMTSTIGQAWTQFGNELLRTVGETDTLVKGSQALIAVLGALAKHVDTIAVAAAVWAAAYGINEANTLRLAVAQRTAAATALAEAEAQAIKARAMGASVVGATALANAETRLAAAQAAATAAGVGKIGMLSRLGSSLLSLAGGPIGLAVIAFGSLAAATYSSIQEEQKRIKQTEETISSTRKAAASLGELADQLDRVAVSMASLPSLAQVISAEDDATRKLATAKAELVVAQEEVARSTDEWLRSGVRLGLTIEQMNPSIVGQRDRVERLSQTIDDLQSSLDRLDMSNLFNPSPEFVAGDQFGQITEALKAGLASAEAQILKTKESTIGYWQELARARVEQAQFAGQSPEQIAALEAENEAWLKTIASTMKKTDATRKERDAGAEFIAHLKEQIATYEQSATAAARYEASTSGLTAAQQTQANALIDQLDEWEKLTQVNDDAADALDSLRDMQSGLGDDIADLRAELGGASKAQIAFNKTQRDAAKAYAIAAAAQDPSALAAYVKTINAAREKLDLTDELEATGESAAELQSILSQFGDLDPFEKLVGSIDLVDAALDKATDPKKIARMQRALGELNKQMEHRNLSLVQQGVSSLQTYAKEGTAAYTALGIAQDVLAYKSAVAAIANQGSGDPYSAFARIAAMIALMASIGLRVGGSGGGFTDTAAQRQATQGTGSVLGDPTADSESIAHGVQITADATSELVGINRGMLNALNTLVARLGSASNMLARGAGEVDFGTFDPGFILNARNGAAMGAVIGSIIPVVGTLVGAVLGGVLGSILGGSSRLTDQGIAISGGSLGDANFSAYQEHQVRSWRFGSRRTVEQTAALPDDVANQFQLVMDSIVDTVREGALALGLVPADIEAAIAAYQLEATRISLKGLSAEEQQQELQAVFSKIFDGLAGQVVPFIGQFQQVGEGLGETLVRVATEVQVMQEAVRYLGIALDETDPERFAQISDDLIQRAGGLEAFITQMTSFADKFAPESYKLEVASESLTAALAQVGLTVPDTEDGMWALMRSLDATTESGREQIATLLRLSDTAGEYYSLLDEAVSSATDFLESLGLAERPLSAFAQELLSIRESGEQAIESANILAQAHGREGASAIQLARIRQWTLAQEAAAIRRLQQQTQDLIAQLYGGLPGSLDAINARISELEGLSGGLVDGLGSIQDASASLFETWAQGVQTVQDYLDSMLVGPLSALSPEEQLAVAQQQLIAMQQLAVGGDANALAQLPQLADTFLQLLQGSGASGADYETGFQWVRDLLQSVVDLPNPGTAAGPAPVELVPSAELIALYAARDAAEAAANAEQRAEWARQLTQNLADMATIMQVPTLEFIEAQGVSLEALATDLGVDFDNLGAQSVSALGFLASTLGVSMTELTASLGLSLADLAPGLTELTASVGIDLAALTAGTTQTLAALGGSLGLNLGEIATALDINLGELADSQSLISQALGAEIGSLPEDQRAELEPLFDAIADATTEADANAAIAALEDAVNLIGGETANALAPYLDGVFPVSALDQLDYLGEIQAIAAEQLDVLGLINSNLRASNIGAGVPSYAVGTSYVPRTGLALIHQGEAIIPASMNPFTSAGGTDERVIVELRQIRQRLESLERSNADGHNKIAGTVADGDYKARLQRDDIDRRKADVARSRAG